MPIALTHHFGEYKHVESEILQPSISLGAYHLSSSHIHRFDLYLLQGQNLLFSLHIRQQQGCFERQDHDELTLEDINKL